MTREEKIAELINIRDHFNYTLAPREVFDDAIKALEQEPRKGHWIKEESVYGWDGHSYQCSECGRSIHLDTAMESLIDYPYCHCGAKMESEVKE